MAVLVDLQQVTVRRVDRDLFNGLSVTVSDGDRLGVVGANGTGKTTLLRIIAGVDQPDEGVVRRSRGARVGFLDQVPSLPPGTVRAAVGEGWEADAALDRLGMGAAADTDVSTLSGGQAKRVALARVLARPAELLVLDEPTNHLDLGAVTWLEQRVASFRGGLVLVTHDRYLLDRLTTRMLELDGGDTYLHEGGYADYLAAKAERDERAATLVATRRNLARRELAWLRRGAPARSRKPLARIEAAKRVIDEGPEPTARPLPLELDSDTPRLGDKVIECAGVGYRYGDGPAVLAGVDLNLGRRERLGIVGANGTGKSTLLDLLAGRRQPTTGTIEVGPTVVVGYYDQHGVDLDGRARVQELVAGPYRSPGSLADVDLMRRFGFAGELAFTRVGTLSGGERRRLQLLLVLAARPNLLLLDEPTNDLDLDTLRALEDYLEEWPGALVVVSHDRVFLSRTTEHLVAVAPDGSVAGVAGGVDGWVARAEAGDGRRAGALAPRPTDDAVDRRPEGTGTRPPPHRAPSAGTGGDGVPLGRRLRDADKAMVRLQKERDRLTDSLAATTDHRRLVELGRELTRAQADLDRAEEEWLALAEEAEGGR